MVDTSYSLEPTKYTWKNALLWGNFIEHCKKIGEGAFGSRFVHLTIALAELIPGISQIVSVFEKIIFSNLHSHPETPTNYSRTLDIPLTRSYVQSTKRVGEEGAVIPRPKSWALQKPEVTIPQISKVVEPRGKTPNELVYSFYRGEGKDIEGRTLNDIWAWDNGKKERQHDYIQWLFPLKVSSAFNKKAPLLNDPSLFNKLRNDLEVVKNLKKSFEVMMKFYGLTFDSVTKQISFANDFKERVAEWATPDNHNFRRITRILTCLKDFGLEEEARAFLKSLHKIKQTHSGISDSNFNFWQQAVNA